MKIFLNRLFLKTSGESFLEMLGVTAIIGILLALAIPATSSFMSPIGRKGAVIVVMNALEHARATAIETGCDVAVLFWKKNGSTGMQPDEPDALMLLRRKEQDQSWEPATRWINLPKGVLFHDEDMNSMILNTPPDSSLLSAIPGNAPEAFQVGIVKFTSSGAIHFPATSNGLQIPLTEGQRGPDGALCVKKQKRTDARELITLARYTGRASMDTILMR